LSVLDRHRPPITAIGWCHKKNTNAFRRQEFFRRWTVSLELSVALRDRDISLVQFKRLLKTLQFKQGLRRIVTTAFLCAMYKYSYLLRRLRKTASDVADLTCCCCCWKTIFCKRKKVQLRLIGSPLRALMSLRRSSYAAPKPGKSSESVQWPMSTHASLGLQHSALYRFGRFALSPPP